MLRCRLQVLIRCQRLSFLGAIGVFSHAEEEEHDAMRMQEIEIQDYARQLLEAHGDKAVAEAAQKACALEKQGESTKAEVAADGRQELLPGEAAPRRSDAPAAMMPLTARLRPN